MDFRNRSRTSINRSEIMDYPKDKPTLEAILRLHEIDMASPGLLPEQKEWLENEIKQVKAALKKAK